MIVYEFLTALFSQNDLEDINNLLPQLSENCKPATRETLCKAIDSSRVLVARDYAIRRPDGTAEIIGMVCLALASVVNGLTGSVEGLVADGEYRGLGIGKALMLGIITEARRLGFTMIDLTSKPDRVAANKLYLSLGFKERETNCYRLELNN